MTADIHQPSMVLPALPETPLDRRAILGRYARRGMHFVPASGARLLVDGGEAYGAMLEAIDGAREHVALETYILRGDATGLRFRQALIRAAARGVCVQLIYDWWGSLALTGHFVREMTRAGVAVGVYHPLVLRRPVWAMNKRDHRKMLIVDGRLSFMGGLNIADEYAPAIEGGGGWRDTHIRLDGPEVAREMAALFNYAWRRATPYDRTRTRRTIIRWGLRRRLARRPIDSAGNETDAWPESDLPVSILGNEILRYRRRIRMAYLKAIHQARRYVLIENAYFIPSRSIRRALVQAARRGVAVGVVVTERNDVPITAYATRWLYEELLSGGVRLFEWPTGMMHAKTAVIDDAWSIIGSYNLDHRSLLHQLESVAIVADAGLAVRLRDQTLADIAACREVSLEAHRQRPAWQKTLEYGAYLTRHWL
jgi:cardiolipin synthase A/B